MTSPTETSGVRPKMTPMGEGAFRVGAIDEEAAARAQEEARREHAEAMRAAATGDVCHCGAHWCGQDQRFKREIARLESALMEATG